MKKTISLFIAFAFATFCFTEFKTTQAISQEQCQTLCGIGLVTGAIVIFGGGLWLYDRVQENRIESLSDENFFAALEKNCHYYAQTFNEELRLLAIIDGNTQLPLTLKEFEQYKIQLKNRISYTVAQAVQEAYSTLNKWQLRLNKRLQSLTTISTEYQIINVQFKELKDHIAQLYAYINTLTIEPYHYDSSLYNHHFFPKKEPRQFHHTANNVVFVQAKQSPEEQQPPKADSFYSNYDETLTCPAN